MVKWCCLASLVFCGAASLATAAGVGRPVAELVEDLESSDWQTRVSAAFALRSLGAAARDALPALSKAKSDENEKVRRHADRALQKIYAALETEVPLGKLIEAIRGEPIRVDTPSGPKYSGHGGIGTAAFISLTIDFAAYDQQQKPLPPGGTVVITIPESPSNQSHAKLTARGLADMGNASFLEVRFRGGYVPEKGEEREVVTAERLKGRFAVHDFPDLPDDLKWDIAYDDLDAGIDRDGDGRADVTLLVVPRGDGPARPRLTDLQRRLVKSSIDRDNKLLESLREKICRLSTDTISPLVEQAEQAAEDAESTTDPQWRARLKASANRLQESVNRVREQHQRVVLCGEEMERAIARFEKMLERDRE